MNLIDENIEKEQAQSKKKLFNIIIIAIIVLVILAIILLIYTSLKKNNTIKFKINGNTQNISSGLFLMSDEKNLYVENNQIYVSVKKLATILGVDYYNDEYKNKGEDTTKCYIKTSNEYTSYMADSSQIYKSIIIEKEVEDDSNNNVNNTINEIEKITEYEYFTIENGVKYVNGELYANQEAIALGFNLDFSFDQKTKSINIYTLEKLEQLAAKLVKNAVTGENCSYSNKKLLKYGLILIQNSEGYYGIANYNNYQEGNYVLSCKYSNIRFCESTGNVIVTTLDDSNVGVLKIDLINIDNAPQVMLEPKYQSINQMDENGNLYMVKENNKYGITDLSGKTAKTILRSQYQAIGIEGNLYKNMNNKYIINDKYIPVKIDNAWGIITTEGKTLIPPQYPGIGCNLGQESSGDGVIVLPKLQNGIDGIVFLIDYENKLYSIINVQTGEKIGLIANEIYSKYENNERLYYMNATNANGGLIRNINIYNLFGSKPPKPENN